MSSTGEYSGSCVCVRRYQDGFRCTRGYQHHPTQQCKCIFIIIIIIINMCKCVSMLNATNPDIMSFAL